MLLVGLLLIAAAGCGIPSEQAGAARTAISAEQVPGIKEAHSIIWTWPENQSSRQFSDVRDVPFDVVLRDAEGKLVERTKIYVVEGKDISTGEWHVFYATKLVNGEWQPLQLSGRANQVTTTTKAAIDEPPAMEANDIQKVMSNGLPAKPPTNNGPSQDLLKKVGPPADLFLRSSTTRPAN